MNAAFSVLESFQKRYAVRQFLPGCEIPASQWEILEKALVLTPSGYGLQPWKFWVVQNPVLRKKLREVSLDQSQVTDCSHFIVFTAKTAIDESYIGRYISRIADVRQVSLDSLQAYHQMMVGDLIHGPKSSYANEWTARQTYIALGVLVSAAAQLRIGTCPMEGIIPEQYDEILKIKGTGYRTLMACALGYGSEQDKYMTLKKVRFDQREIVYYV